MSIHNRALYKSMPLPLPQRIFAVNETTQPASTEAPKTNSPPTVGTSPQARVADYVDERQDVYQESVVNRQDRWNEHEYYVRARSDLQKQHHEKIANVTISSSFLFTVYDN